MQSLNVIIFRLLKHYQHRTVDKAARQLNTSFNKMEFLNTFHEARIKTFTTSTITSG